MYYPRQSVLQQTRQVVPVEWPLKPPKHAPHSSQTFKESTVVFVDNRRSRTRLSVSLALVSSAYVPPPLHVSPVSSLASPATEPEATYAP